MYACRVVLSKNFIFTFDMLTQSQSIYSYFFTRIFHFSRRGVVACTFSLFLVSLFFWQTFAQEQGDQDQCTSDYDIIEQEFLWTFTKWWTTLVDVLVWHQDLWTQKWNLIWYFCNTWFKTHNEDNAKRKAKNLPEIPDLSAQCVDKWSLRFDPRQSFFMYWLCVWYDDSMQSESSYTHKNRKEQFVDLEYLLPVTITWENDKKIVPNIEQFISQDVKDNLLEDRRNLWVWNGSIKDDPCYPPTWMSRCHMWYPTTQILEEIFSPLFDIKKASIDWANHWRKKKHKNDAIADLSRSLFSSRDTKEWICTTAQDQFLMENDSKSDDKRSHCWHPKTWNFVSLMIDWALQDVSDSSLFDYDAILEEPCEDLKWTMLTCAMSYVPYESEWSEDIIFRSEEKSRKNLLANELFFANMRYAYYSQQLLASPNLQWPGEQQNLDDKRQRALYEVESLQEMLWLIEKATSTMSHLLAQYRSMYHQCISLTAYQEDLHYFWQRLNLTYTPLHQIQYLITDPQVPQTPS